MSHRPLSSQPTRWSHPSWDWDGPGPAERSASVAPTLPRPRREVERAPGRHRSGAELRLVGSSAGEDRGA